MANIKFTNHQCPFCGDSTFRTDMLIERLENMKNDFTTAKAAYKAEQEVIEAAREFYEAEQFMYGSAISSKHIRLREAFKALEKLGG